MRKAVQSLVWATILVAIRAMAQTQSAPEILKLDGMQASGACETLASTATGLSLAQVQHRAEQKNLVIRVTKSGKTSLPVTMDFRPDRLNLELSTGKVACARCG